MEVAMSALQWILVLLGWFSLFVFVLGTAYKAVKYYIMPLNLRWEVYPVPHETKEKRHYGGSYMEEVDWVKKPRHTSLIGEITEMGSEILFLKKIWKYNSYNIWPFSLAMHWGIYLLFFWIFLLMAGIVLETDVIYKTTGIIGIAAFILGTFGCLMLIIRRITNKELNLYTEPVEYFNLSLLLSIFITGIISWFIDPSFLYSRRYIKGIITFNLPPILPVVVLNFILFEAFLIYMPFSKYLHFVAKYFNFHQSLWDDAFKVKDSEIDKRIIKQLSYNIKWAGPHVVPDKSWLEESQLAVLEEKKGETK